MLEKTCLLIKYQSKSVCMVYNVQIDLVLYNVGKKTLQTENKIYAIEYSRHNHSQITSIKKQFYVFKLSMGAVVTVILL